MMMMRVFHSFISHITHIQIIVVVYKVVMSGKLLNEFIFLFNFIIGKNEKKVKKSRPQFIYFIYCNGILIICWACI